MKIGLRVRLIGTIAVAIFISFAISVVAARTTMARDLANLSTRGVANGAHGFSDYWDAKNDLVRLLVVQTAKQDEVKRGILRHRGDLATRLDELARATRLSFLTVVDRRGQVIARSSGSARGSLGRNAYVVRALHGETLSTPARLPLAELQADGLEQSAQNPLGLIAAAPLSDSNGVIGAVYGGVLVSHFYDTGEADAKALGGKSAIVLDGQIASSTLSHIDGTHVAGERSNLDRHMAAGDIYAGEDMEGGTRYVARVDPIKNEQGIVIAQQWYGLPKADFDAIANRTTQSILVWGLVGLVLALLAAIPAVEALSRDLIARSKQNSRSANELAVIIAGGEVSSDHITHTLRTVEALDGALENVQAVAEIADLKRLSFEVHSDVVVIDTLAKEMNERIRQASSIVHELQDVAAGLEVLVTGSSA